MDLQYGETGLLVSEKNKREAQEEEQKDDDGKNGGGKGEKLASVSPSHASFPSSYTLAYTSTPNSTPSLSELKFHPRRQQRSKRTENGHSVQQHPSIKARCKMAKIPFQNDTSKYKKYVQIANLQYKDDCSRRLRHCDSYYLPVLS